MSETLYMRISTQNIACSQTERARDRDRETERDRETDRETETKRDRERREDRQTENALVRSRLSWSVRVLGVCVRRCMIKNY